MPDDLEDYLEERYGTDFRRENAKSIIKDFFKWRSEKRTAEPAQGAAAESST